MLAFSISSNKASSYRLSSSAENFVYREPPQDFEWKEGELSFLTQYLTDPSLSSKASQASGIVLACANLAAAMRRFWNSEREASAIHFFTGRARKEKQEKKKRTTSILLLCLHPETEKILGPLGHKTRVESWECKTSTTCPPMANLLQAQKVYFSLKDVPKPHQKGLVSKPLERYCTHCHKKPDGYVD